MELKVLKDIIVDQAVKINFLTEKVEELENEIRAYQASERRLSGIVNKVETTRDVISKKDSIWKYANNLATENIAQED